MSLITAKDIISAEAPDDLYDSLIIGCQEAEHKLSKKQQPQVVSKWEIIGVRNKENGIDRELVRNGRTYVIAGLTILPVYMSLTPKAIKFFRDFWVKATGKPESEFAVDTDNPDLSFMDNLAMSAIIKAVKLPKTKPVTEEQKAAAQAENREVEAEPVLDDEGNAVYSKFLQLDTWNKRFTGQLPQF